MPVNQFSVWSQVFDLRDEKAQLKIALTEKDMDTIERLFRGESAGIKLHKLKGTLPPVYSASVNDTRRLLFITHGSTLALIGILEHHNYQDLQPGFAEKFYRKAAADLGDGEIACEPITAIENLARINNDERLKVNTCISYHQKFITLDTQQSQTLTLPTPAVIIGDPGSGKSSLCSVMMEKDITELANDNHGGLVVYFSESSGLAEKMAPAWIMDHPVTARRPEANQLVFANYHYVLMHFGPPGIQEKKMVGELEFRSWMTDRLSHLKQLDQYQFIQTDDFEKLAPTLYHEFQIITVTHDQAAYLTLKGRANFPEPWRAFVLAEYQRYVSNLTKRNEFDPNLMLWEPSNQPFARLYHDESLSASPAMNLMLYRLTKDANIVFFADPNQENTKQISDLAYITSELGVNGAPVPVTTLKTCYRLPKTIADLANQLLKIKQNINGGKNEKNQSDQIVCHADSDRHPGILSWRRLAAVQSLADELNRKNQVYVVITHPEYKEEAKKYFGEQATVISIEEARGQEFDTVVLYRITDPGREAAKLTKGKKKSLTLLEQVNRVLATLDPSLQSKPNLAKRGRGNRYFESYMNSLYIAVSRITHQGYLVEAGDPQKNELHKRLLLTITESMRDVRVEDDQHVASVEDVLLQARLDLAEGRIMQAKAGFLRAGRSEQDFQAEWDEIKQREDEFIQRTLKARQSEGVDESADAAAVTAEPKIDARLFNEIIREDRRSKLKNALSQLSCPLQLAELGCRKGKKSTSYFAAILEKRNLRPALLEYLLDHPSAMVALFNQVNMDMPVLVAFDNNERKTPLLLALAASESGLAVLNELAITGRPALFGGLTASILKDEKLIINGLMANQVLLQSVITSNPRLLWRMLSENIGVVHAFNQKWWLQPFVGSMGQVSQDNFITLLLKQITLTSGELQMKLVDVLLMVLTLVIDSDFQKEAFEHFFTGKPHSIFDLILTNENLIQAVGIILNAYGKRLSETYLLEAVSCGDSVSPRIQIVLQAEQTREIGKEILLSMALGVSLTERDTFDRLASQYLSQAALVAAKEDQLVKAIKCDAWSEKDIIMLFNREDMLPLLKKPIQTEDGCRSCHLVSLLNNDRVRLKISYFSERDHLHATEQTFYDVFKSFIKSLTIDHTVEVKDFVGNIQVVPTWHYLLDQYDDVFKRYIDASFLDLDTVPLAPQYKTPYYSAKSESHLDVITLFCMFSTDFFMEFINKVPAYVELIDWKVLYHVDDGSVFNVFSALVLQNDLSLSRDVLKKIESIIAILKRDEAKISPHLDVCFLFLTVPDDQGVYSLSIFDLLLRTPVGRDVVNLYSQALIQSPRFMTFFNERFLLGPLSDVDLITSYVDDNEDVFSPARFFIIAVQDELIPILMQFLKETDDIAYWVKELIKHQCYRYVGLQDYTWSAFANLVTSAAHEKVLMMLIDERPQALADLPEAVWHAPVTDESAGTVPQRNFMLLKYIINKHSDSVIGRYFEEHYPAEYREAVATETAVYLTLAEREVINDAKLIKIHAREIIKKDSPDLLMKALADKNNFPCLLAVYKEATVIEHIFESNSLRGALLRFLSELLSMRSMDALIAFFDAVDLNLMLADTAGTVKHFIRHIYDNPGGIEFLTQLIEYDPPYFLNKISVNTLAYTHRGDGLRRESTMAFLYNLLMDSLPLSVLVLTYSKHIGTAFQVIAERGYSLEDQVRSILTGLCHKLADNERNVAHARKAIIIMMMLIELVPSVLHKNEKTAAVIFGKDAKSVSILDQSLGYLSKDQLQDFINLIRDASRVYANFVAEKFKIKENKTYLAVSRYMRNLLRHGLSPSLMGRYEAMIQNHQQELFKELVSHGALITTLNAALSDGRSLLCHLYESDFFRKTLITYLCNALNLCQTDPEATTQLNRLMREKNILTMITRQGHRLPLYFDLMHSEDTSAIASFIGPKKAMAALSAGVFSTPYHSIDLNQRLTLVDIFSAKRPTELCSLLAVDSKFFRLIDHSVWLHVETIQGKASSPLARLLSEADKGVIPAQKMLKELLSLEHGLLTYANDSAWHDEMPCMSSEGETPCSHFDLLLNDSNRAAWLSVFLNHQALPVECLLGKLKHPHYPTRLFQLTTNKDILFLLKFKKPAGDSEALNAWDAAIYEAIHAVDATGACLIEQLAGSQGGRWVIVNLMTTFSGLPRLFAQDLLANKFMDRYDRVLFRFMTGDPVTYDVYNKIYTYSTLLSERFKSLERIYELKFDEVSLILNGAEIVAPNDDTTEFIEYTLWLSHLQVMSTIERLGYHQLGKPIAFIRLLAHPPFRLALIDYFKGLSKAALIINLDLIVKYVGLCRVFKAEDGTQIPLISALLDLIDNQRLLDAMYQSEHSPYQVTKVASLSDWIQPYLEFQLDGNHISLSHLDTLLLDARLHPIANLVFRQWLKSFVSVCNLKEAGNSYLFSPFMTFSGLKTRAAILLETPEFHLIFLGALKDKAFDVYQFAAFLNTQAASLAWLDSLKASPFGKQIISFIVQHPELFAMLNPDLCALLTDGLPSSTPLVRQGLFQAPLPYPGAVTGSVVDRTQKKQN